MEQAKHTPGPWESANDGFVMAAGGRTTIALMYATDVPGAARANAARIVKCVNAHDDLVAALRTIAATTPGNVSPMARGWVEEHVSIARAALAKAGVQQ